MTEAQEKLVELAACMFGTLAARDPAEGVGRPKRLADGWRHGCSRLFELDGKLYGENIEALVLEPRGTDAVMAMFQSLHETLTARAQAEIEALPVAQRAMQDAPKPNACCNVAGNLVQRKDLEKPDLTVMVCRVCRCRHFELTVDAAKIVARGGSVG